MEDFYDSPQEDYDPYHGYDDYEDYDPMDGAFDALIDRFPYRYFQLKIYSLATIQEKFEFNIHFERICACKQIYIEQEGPFEEEGVHHTMSYEVWYGGIKTGDGEIDKEYKQFQKYLLDHYAESPDQSVWIEVREFNGRERMLFEAAGDATDMLNQLFVWIRTQADYYFDLPVKERKPKPALREGEWKEGFELSTFSMFLWRMFDEGGSERDSAITESYIKDLMGIIKKSTHWFIQKADYYSKSKEEKKRKV
jgi:hypothetical protein